MYEALEKCNRLHHDISVGNIILIRELDKDGNRIFRAELIDWELSSKASAMAEHELTVSLTIFPIKNSFKQHYYLLQLGNLAIHLGTTPYLSSRSRALFS